MDITIKNVPEGYEDKVKEFAMVRIERILRVRDCKVSDAVRDKFELDVDTIRVANNLDKKFNVEKVVAVEETPVK